MASIARRTRSPANRTQSPSSLPIDGSASGTTPPAPSMKPLAQLRPATTAFIASAIAAKGMPSLREPGAPVELPGPVPAFVCHDEK
jgi:hypothetical protein